MALDIKQYFFDSIEPNGTDPGDERIYPADEFVSGAIESILTNGIYDLGNNCKIVPTEYAYTVAMLPGKAVINGYIMDALPASGDADVRHLIQLEPPSGTVRCDRIVVRLNVDFTLSGRYIRPVVIKGTEGSLDPPELVRDGEIYDLSLATVILRQSASVIPEEDITDTRYDPDLCGVVDFRPRPDLSGLIQHLYNKWTTEYQEALEAAMAGFETIEDVPGILPVAKGGTGATTAEAARDALGAAAKSVTYTATLTAAGWTGSGPYTQTVTVTGIASTDEPIVDVLLSSNNAIAAEELEAWAMVSKITTSTNSITAVCLEDKPQINLSVRLKVVY